MLLQKQIQLPQAVTVKSVAVSALTDYSEIRVRRHKLDLNSRQCEFLYALPAKFVSEKRASLVINKRKSLDIVLNKQGKTNF